MFQIRNDSNDDTADVIFYSDTTINRFLDVVDRERKNLYAVYHWLTQTKTYMNWPWTYTAVYSGLTLFTRHHRKRVAQVGPTDSTIYNVWVYFKGVGRQKCIKMLLFVICVALKITITPEIKNYYYFTFYSRYSIINIIAVLNYFLGQLLD